MHVSYKNVLLGRHCALQDSGDDPAPLRYDDWRNYDALRAWRRRYDERCVRPSSPPRRSWLSGLVGAYTEASFR